MPRPSLIVLLGVCCAASAVYGWWASSADRRSPLGSDCLSAQPGAALTAPAVAPPAPIDQSTRGGIEPGATVPTAPDTAQADETDPLAPLRDCATEEEAANDLLNDLIPADPPGLLSLLGGILQDTRYSPTWRNYVVQHLANHYELHLRSAALQLIEDAVENPEPEVQDVAVFSLARLARDLGRPELMGKARSAIAKGLSATRAVLVQDAAIRAIGVIADRDRIPGLVALLAEPRNQTQIRLAAADVLGCLLADTALPVLRQVADHPGSAPTLAKAASRAMDRIDPRAAASPQDLP